MVTNDLTALSGATLGGIVLVAVSAGLSLFALHRLQPRLRVRWHVGSYVHLGPETVATAAFAYAVPLIVAALAGATVVLAVALHARVESAPVRSIVPFIGVLGAGTVVVAQALIIVANVVAP